MRPWKPPCLRQSKPSRRCRQGRLGTCFAGRRSEAAWQPEDLRHLGLKLVQARSLPVRRYRSAPPAETQIPRIAHRLCAHGPGLSLSQRPAAVVLKQLFLLLVLCGGRVSAKVTLLGDGARWIANFFQECLAAWPLAELIVDWYHCRKKCYDYTSLIAHGRTAKAELLGLLLTHLWRGQVQEAIDILEEYRPQTKNLAKLDDLIAYWINAALSPQLPGPPHPAKVHRQCAYRKSQRLDRRPQAEASGHALERDHQ